MRHTWMLGGERTSARQMSGREAYQALAVALLPCSSRVNRPSLLWWLPGRARAGRDEGICTTGARTADMRRTEWASSVPPSLWLPAGACLGPRSRPLPVARRRGERSQATSPLAALLRGEGSQTPTFSRRWTPTPPPSLVGKGAGGVGLLGGVVGQDRRLETGCESRYDIRFGCWQPRTRTRATLRDTRALRRSDTEHPNVV